MTVLEFKSAALQGYEFVRFPLIVASADLTRSDRCQQAFVKQAGAALTFGKLTLACLQTIVRHLVGKYREGGGGTRHVIRTFGRMHYTPEDVFLFANGAVVTTTRCDGEIGAEFRPLQACGFGRILPAGALTGGNANKTKRNEIRKLQLFMNEVSRNIRDGPPFLQNGGPSLVDKLPLDILGAIHNNKNVSLLVRGVSKDWKNAVNNKLQFGEYVGQLHTRIKKNTLVL